MGIFSFFSKKNPEKEEPEAKRINENEWPLSPPRHADDVHYQMNEYNVFGVYCFIASNSRVIKEVTEVNFYVVALMENGYGERYANIIKDSNLITNFDMTSRVRNTEDWKHIIKPWLENKTDHIPLQDGIVIAELSDQIRRMKEQIEKNKLT